MFSNKSLLIIIALLISYAPKATKLANIVFMGDDELFILNGQVKEISVRYEDVRDKWLDVDDYTIVTLNKTGDVIKTNNDFRGMAYIVYSNTKHTGKSLQTTQITDYYLRSEMDRMNHHPAPASAKHPGSDTAKSGLTTYKYNKRNEIAGYFHSFLNGTDTKTIYKYNDERELIECDGLVGTPDWDIRKYKYDKSHNPVEIDQSSARKDIVYKTFYVYKSFDSNKNWIKAVKTQKTLQTFPNGRVWTDYSKSIIITRKITYY